MNKPQLDDFETFAREIVTVAHETAGSVEEVIRISGEMLVELEQHRAALRRLFSLDAERMARVCDAIGPFVADDPRCFVAAVDAACDTAEGLPVV